MSTPATAPEPDLEQMRAINDAMAELMRALGSGDPEATADARQALADLLGM